MDGITEVLKLFYANPIATSIGLGALLWLSVGVAGLRIAYAEGKLRVWVNPGSPGRIAGIALGAPVLVVLLVSSLGASQPAPARARLIGPHSVDELVVLIDQNRPDPNSPLYESQRDLLQDQLSALFDCEFRVDDRAS
jgi:hypothetical protein